MSIYDIFCFILALALYIYVWNLMNVAMNQFEEIKKQEVFMMAVTTAYNDLHSQKSSKKFARKNRKQR